MPEAVVKFPRFTMLRKLLELIRFSHTLFALPFALLAAAMAWSANFRSNPPVAFRWSDLLGILACMVFARSAAMAFNRLADRRLDALNPRTNMRHLPAGVLGMGSVIFFTACCSVGFIASTLLFLPRNPIPLMALLPVLAFLFGYSYAKRFTALSHFWLGAALMLAPLAAWVAIRPEFSWAPVTLDFDFDVKMRLRSVPARFGVAGALRLAAACHFAAVVLLFLVPLVYDGFGLIYLAGVATIGILLIYEHWLVRPDDLSRVNRAFFHVNAVISLGLLVVGVADLVIQYLLYVVCGQ